MMEEGKLEDETKEGYDTMKKTKSMTATELIKSRC